MCGLKQKCQYYHQNRQYVTPHVGVWIETDMRTKEVPRDSVTPHVGVWIETSLSQLVTHAWAVTPHVGVWIETDNRNS